MTAKPQVPHFRSAWEIDRWTRPTYYRLAAAKLRELKRDREIWEEGYRQDAVEGYRASRCFHGTYLWTDYDPICGECEDEGFYPTDEVLARRALRFALEQASLIMARSAVLTTALNEANLRGLHVGSNEPWVDALSNWALMPAAHLKKKGVIQHG